MAPRVRWADVGHAETFEQDVRRKAAALGWRDAERPGVADALEFLWKRTDIEPEALDAVGGLIEASKKELASDLDRRHGS